jgi:cation-transporting ATPase E
MDCTDAVLLDEAYEQNVPKALASLVAALEDRNATFTAIAAKYSDPTPWRAEKAAAFSSRTKWSGATFEGQGTYILGAAEFVMPTRSRQLQEALYEYSQENRVLLLAHADEPLPEKGLPMGLQPVALLLLQDNIRKAAPATLRYFREQGVTCKVISGDSVDTVSGIARRAGVDNWDKAVDMSTVAKKDIPAAAEKYTIFGRVTPEQKKLLVKAQQKAGHTVAMTGDGVNDVMALKEADCGIAIAGGADAARNVAHLVLLKSNFEALPKVVAEGRRAINNIQRSASLFLVKTVYATILSLAFLFITAPYPFEPIHLTLIGLTTTGIPSVVLGLQPNHERVQGHFLKNVLTTAAPCGITIALAVLMAVLCGQAFDLAQTQVEAMCVLLTGGAILILLFYVCHPWTPVRVVLFCSMTFLFLLGYFGFNDFFSIERFVPSTVLLLVLIGVGSWEIFRILWQLFHGQKITLVPRPAADYEHPSSASRGGKRQRR